jgi:hypothetical protein
VETSRIRYSILLSAGIQLILGAFTLHPYDGRIFFTVGYSVAHGNSPYVPTDVSGVFGHALFPEVYPGIGYPPPWGLMLGLSYLLSYNLFPSVILYDLAIKVPIVIGNILLALLVGRIVRSETSNSTLSKNAIGFMLFNPYVIYTTSIWGQFDTLSMLLMLFAIFALTQGKQRLSAAALGGAIALKLIPIVLLPLLVHYVRKHDGWHRAFLYFVCAAGVVGVSFLPFLLGWSINPIVDNWNVHFVRIGAFSPMNLLIPFGIASSTNELSFLGYLWVPSLALIYYLLSRSRIVKPSDLVLSALAVTLGLSLTRSWVSEQNLNFVLPLVLLASISQGWSRRWVTATWMLPLAFTVFNSSPLGMLFLVVPQQLIDQIHVHLQLLLHAVSLDMFQLAGVARTLTTIAWLIVGLALLRKSIHHVRLSSRTVTVTSDSTLQNCT